MEPSTICDVCRQPASKRCGKCKVAYYCSVDHQTEAWPIRRKHCGKALRPVIVDRSTPPTTNPSQLDALPVDSDPVDTSSIPFDSTSGLTRAHLAELVKIRGAIKEWSSVFESVKDKWRVRDPEALKKIDEASERFSKFEVSPAFAFTPAPPQKFRRILLFIIKTYFTALVTSLSQEKREELGYRLNAVPPYGERIPQFKGKKCVDEPGALSARVYEGLMRTISMVVIGMVDKEVVIWWREVSELGVMTWEERV
ncbi:hypothetical protein JAAARDRAFT_36408 [Jaapia argillacea MUCL 33604]|uniref:MYND-type domain-containing protein n=1 Tax=Jaapia argillacea MUCL 33604 TaxID=933084 RepID=A0A067PQY7_9AGAM|nr:hypothetical protein JAAARDRAFT_36408 [Jaapia argillacea MUCL 33604]